MNTLRKNPDNLYPIVGLSAVLALTVGIAYFLIDVHLLAINFLKPSEEPPAIIYVTALCYVIGALLILARRRWLWVYGAIMNGFVIVFFFQLYKYRLEVLLSPGGWATTIIQILLEMTLFYLIIRDLRNQTRQER